MHFSKVRNEIFSKGQVHIPHSKILEWELEWERGEGFDSGCCLGLSPSVDTQSSTLIGLYLMLFGTMMFTQGDCMLVGRSKCRVGAHICIRNVQNPYDKHEVATKRGMA